MHRIFKKCSIKLGGTLSTVKYCSSSKALNNVDFPAPDNPVIKYTTGLFFTINHPFLELLFGINKTFFAILSFFGQIDLFESGFIINIKHECFRKGFKFVNISCDIISNFYISCIFA